MEQRTLPENRRRSLQLFQAADSQRLGDRHHNFEAVGKERYSAWLGSPEIPMQSHRAGGVPSGQHQMPDPEERVARSIARGLEGNRIFIRSGSLHYAITAVEEWANLEPLTLLKLIWRVQNRLSTEYTTEYQKHIMARGSLQLLVAFHRVSLSGRLILSNHFKLMLRLSGRKRNRNCFKASTHVWGKQYVIGQGSWSASARRLRVRASTT